MGPVGIIEDIREAGYLNKILGDTGRSVGMRVGGKDKCLFLRARMTEVKF